VLEVMETYVVCFGQLDEFLDSERVVWILVGVLQKRHLAELLFDVVDSRVGWQVQDCEWVEALEGLHRRNLQEIQVPDIPEEGADEATEDDCSGESIGGYLPFLHVDQGNAVGALAVRLELLKVLVAEDETFEEVVGVGEGDEGKQGH